MNLKQLLTTRVRAAMQAAGAPDDCAPHVAVSKNPQFGDYQANGAMAAAKRMKMPPRDLAQKTVDALVLDDIAERVEIAGPGFINIHLHQAWLADQLVEPREDDAEKRDANRVVVDYSSPNLAKEMHVGHLRSTIIGDAMARLLEFRGDTVIRQNHVGDWGTQFGMLIAELEAHLKEGEQAELALADLESFYQQAKAHFDADSTFADKARDYVVKLQSGDAEVLRLWAQFRAVSLAHNQEVYGLLNVTLSPEDTHGESAYNDDLATLTQDLSDRGLAEDDAGARVVRLEEFKTKDGDPMGVIIRKQDGGFLYTTTDLAAIRYRVGELKANRLLYFIDARQSQHMQQVFTIARKADYADKTTSLEHHAFGMMLNRDGKPYKTREGGTVKLRDLLNEAVERAAKAVAEKNPDLDATQAKVVAEKVGIGAIKYADLAKTRTHDYVFDWDTMLAFEGNTGPYMQYAYARICAIFRRANIDRGTHRAPVVLNDIRERALAVKLLQFDEVIEQVAEDALLHTLCGYLYDLASEFMRFYEACPILKSEVSASVRDSRLFLAKETAAKLHRGLSLLGIDVMEQM